MRMGFGKLVEVEYFLVSLRVDHASWLRHPDLTPSRAAATFLLVKSCLQRACMKLSAWVLWNLRRASRVTQHIALRA